MVRKRIVIARGNRLVAYSTKREALRVKDRAPGSNRVRVVKVWKTRNGIVVVEKS